jgi:hypothetical protein
VNNSDYRYVLVLNPAHAEPELNADAAHLDAPRHQNVRGKK